MLSGICFDPDNEIWFSTYSTNYARFFKLGGTTDDAADILANSTVTNTNATITNSTSNTAETNATANNTTNSLLNNSTPN